MDYTNTIVNYIRENRVSTTEVADALGKHGVLSGVNPIVQDQFKVGRVRCIFTANNSNYALHEQIRHIEPGEIIVAFEHNCGERALFGSLVSKYAVLYKRAEAIVVNGMVRDMAVLRRERFPLWVKGGSPLGCYNDKAEPFPRDMEKTIRDEYEGGIAVCDDGGVTIIPRQKINEEMLQALKRIEMQEDIWFFCLDTLKWDTHKIVCEKAYLTQKELLSRIHIDNLHKLNMPLD